jgi:hypothetical protein
MKIVKFTLISFAAISSLLSHEHYQSLSWSSDYNDLSSSQFHLESQSHLVFRDDNFIVAHAAYRPNLNKVHHFEAGYGFRKFFCDTTGFGLNLFHEASTRPDFLIHQFSPGIELFYGRFQLSANAYIPLKKEIVRSTGSVFHHTISEYGLTFRPSSRLEFGIFPFFDHKSRHWGYNGNAMLTVADSVTFGLNPFYKEGNHGCTLSMGVYLGGKKFKRTQPIRKTSMFLFHEVARKKSIAAPIPPIKVPTVDPVVVPPIISPPAPVDPGMFIVPVPIPLPYNNGKPAEESQSWKDWFFSRFRKPTATEAAAAVTGVITFEELMWQKALLESSNHVTAKVVTS